MTKRKRIPALFEAFRRTVALGVASALLAAAPLPAAWDDRSGELPGFTTKEAIGIGVAVAAGAGVALWLLNRNSDRQRVELGLRTKPASPAKGSACHVEILNVLPVPVTISDLKVKGSGVALGGPESEITLEPGERLNVPIDVDPTKKGRGKLKLHAEAPDHRSRTFKVPVGKVGD